MYDYRTFCFIVALFLYMIPTEAVQTVCQSDNDCSSGHGVCTAVGSTSFCSCLSGFGGPSCELRPDSACASSFGSVSSTASTFQTNSTLSYLYPNLTLEISANLEESKFAYPHLNDTLNVIPYSKELIVIFGNGSYTQCNFPNNATDWRDLRATSGNCTDKYSLSLAFTDAKTKCGFADTNGNRIFQQVINIERKYLLESLRGETMTRTDTSVKTLRVIFPLEVNISTSSVQVVGSPSLLAAITFVDFDPAVTPEKWIVQTTTSIQSPYKLTNPTVISTTGLISSENRFQSGSENISVVSGCGNNTQDCFQKVSLNFVKGSAADACNALSGTATVRMNVTCSEGTGSSCPLLGGETVQITLNLNTSDACPVTEQITFSTTTLNSYSNSGVTTARTSFITNQIAYFGADVQSTDASITGRTVKSGSVCFQIGSGTCQPVQYSVIASANGKDPVFSVDLSNSNNTGVFGFLNAVDASSQLFVVKATIQVNFAGVSKKTGIHKEQSQERDLDISTIVKIEPGVLKSAASGISYGITSILFSLLTVFVSQQLL